MEKRASTAHGNTVEEDSILELSPPAGEGHSTDLLVDSASGPHDGATERQIEPVRET